MSENVMSWSVSALRSLIIAVTLLAASTQPAWAGSVCFDQVQGQFTLRPLSHEETQLAVDRRISWLVEAQSRALGGVNRVDVDDLLRAEFMPLSVELNRLAELSLTRPESVVFRTALKSMMDARELVLGHVEKLQKALRPAGLIGRLLSRSVRGAGYRADLEAKILACRSVVATCVVDLDTHSLAYRHQHETYQRIGRAVDQQMQVWNAVRDHGRLVPQTRQRIDQHIVNLSQMRLIIEGLISTSDADLFAAGQHLQFVNVELPIVLRGLVAQGASPSVIAPVKTRYDIEAEQAAAKHAAEAKRVEEEKRRHTEEQAFAAKAAALKLRTEEEEARKLAAQKKADQLAEQERLDRLKFDLAMRPPQPSIEGNRRSEDAIRHEKVSDRIEIIVRSSYANSQTRLGLFYDMFFRGNMRVSAKQALWILNVLQAGVQFGWEKGGLIIATLMIKDQFGRLYDSANFYTSTDSDLLLLLIKRTESERDEALRKLVVDRAESLWLASDNQTTPFSPEFRADFEAIWKSVLRDWHERSAK